MAFGHFLLGPHNFMVTVLGSCVNWPSVCNSCSMGSQNIVVKCSKSCAERHIFKLNSQHPTIIF